MPAYVTVTLDTSPPSNPSIVINGGATITGTRSVLVSVSTPSADVFSMKLWGDVDPTADPAVQVTEADSAWIPYTGEIAVMVSANAGRKTLYARLRDDVLNTSVVVSDFIDFDSLSPVVTITTPVDRGRISKMTGANVSTFSWQSNQDFTNYVVRVVPSVGSPVTTGVPVGIVYGSINVAGSGVFSANTQITTQINGADLEAANPGNTTKTVKVYVQNASGVWSA